MQIANNTVVSLHYRLRQDNAEGELIEETFGSDPLTFLYGAGQMLPAFEEQLEGKGPGDEFDFSIQADDAYGEYDPEARASMPLSAFIIDGRLAEDMLIPGKVIPLRHPDGHLLYATVEEVGEEEVLMDFNHPMAGVDLHFTGQVESVREATDSEIDHGHAHGPDGHDHH